jgi:hypothetical protein
VSSLFKDVTVAEIKLVDPEKYWSSFGGDREAERT